MDIKEKTLYTKENKKMSGKQKVFISKEVLDIGRGDFRSYFTKKDLVKRDNCDSLVGVSKVLG